MKTNITAKSLFFPILVALIGMALAGFWQGFLCVEGFLSGVVYYSTILTGLAIFRIDNVK